MTSNQLTLEEVKEKIFTPVAKPEVSFGYNKPSCWFKFEAENQHAFPVQLVLSNNYNTFDRIDIFFRLGDSIQQKSIGDTVDYSKAIKAVVQDLLQNMALILKAQWN